jgi:hypothetical protein
MGMGLLGMSARQIGVVRFLFDLFCLMILCGLLELMCGSLVMVSGTLVVLESL